MKTQIKSLLSIAVAVSLGLGFTSCKKDEPEPKPEPEPTPTEVEYSFINSIGFNTDFVDYCDIKIDLTDIDGKKTTTNIKDCPIEDVLHAGEKIKCYVFTNSVITKEKGKETTMEVTYTPKDFPEDANINILFSPGFVVGSKGDVQALAAGVYFGGVKQQGFEKCVETFKKSFSKFVMKVDKNGKATLDY
mgnify:FL=1